MRPQDQHQRSGRATQAPTPRTRAVAIDFSLPFAFSCLVCLSLLVSTLIILPR